ncbi:acyl carrier protein [Gandjariella thermophila]|uniref:Putative acyl carrier protein n=1 Tax=Gandjariella thermophila TaxID=1931992 RepID=A0A4D4J587_9PSEU|nr:acyl carrier protein [Gandjariella thermophila]GDY29706.1 putative acyl carrier protein [Gandjariella thermophila]
MSARELEPQELAEVITTVAGVTVTARSLTDPPTRTFADLGLDSLALLGVVAELSRRYGIPSRAEALECRTPRDLMAFVNDEIRSGV